MNSTPDPSARPQWFTVAACVAVVLLCCAIIGGYFVGSYQGTDENGYLLTAKRLAVNGDIAKRTQDSNEFVSGNWVEARENTYYAKYPIGYPALCALAYKVGGPQAVFLVNPTLAVLAVVGVFFLGRALLGDFAGALAAIFLATNPIHGFYAISALSHAGAICFAVWGMCFVWRWTERGGWINAILGAAFTAYAVTVRYTEALLVFPAAAMVVWRCVGIGRANRSRESERSSTPQTHSGVDSAPANPAALAHARRYLPWGQLLAMIVVALLVLTPLIIQHWVAYGSPFVSGYSLCGEATGFGWKWFEKNWRLMLGRLDFPGLFLIFPLGVAGLCYLLAHRPKLGVFLTLWVLPGLLLYTAYYWAPEGEGPSYIRFFVSIFPPLILAALALLCLTTQPRPAWTVALGFFALLVAGVNLHETNRQLDRKTDGLLFSKTLSDAVREKAPPGSVILSDDGVLNYVEYAGDYRLYSQTAYDRNAMLNKTKVLKDDEPHPFHRQKAKNMEKWLGNKTDSQLNDLLCEHLGKQIAEGHNVVLITSQKDAPRWRGRLSQRFEFTTLAECVETKQSPKGELNSTGWSLYGLKGVDGNALARTNESRVLETKIAQNRFRVDALKSEYQQQFPGAKESWAKISDLEKQARDLQEELKRARAKEKEKSVAKDAKRPDSNVSNVSLKATAVP